jgi:hypothetical protein
VRIIKFCKLAVVRTNNSDGNRMRIEKFLQNTNPEPEEPLGTINDNKGIG